ASVAAAVRVDYFDGKAKTKAEIGFAKKKLIEELTSALKDQGRKLDHFDVACGAPQKIEPACSPLKLDAGDLKKNNNGVTCQQPTGARAGETQAKKQRPMHISKEGSAHPSSVKTAVVIDKFRTAVAVYKVEGARKRPQKVAENDSNGRALSWVQVAVTILARENDLSVRKTLEAFWIASQNPEINRRDERRIFMGDEVEAAKAKRLRFNGSEIVEAIVDSKNRCDLFRRLFDFFPTLSKEERQFPLAYAMLVHKDLVQVLMLLSAVYQPQNQFCVAVDGKADQKFWMAINELSNCYPNIAVVVSSKEVFYNLLLRISPSLTYSLYLKRNGCLSKILSGVDAPLKTNLEMVRILTALNGSFNTEISPFERYRLRRKRSKDSPLPLVKSSLSAAFSRESANFMTNSEVRYVHHIAIFTSNWTLF
ncbi:unnamed protein product, partial [Heligmosomoides polygyrus]